MKLVVMSCCLFWALAGYAGRNDDDEKIARYAAVIARNRLADNLDDKRAKVLLKLARQMTPDDDEVLYTLAFVEAQKQPAKTETKVTEEKLLEVIRRRAIEMCRDEYPKNRKVAPLSLAYFRVIEFCDPKDDIVQFAILKWKVRGYSDDLTKALAADLRLPLVFKDPEPPKPAARWERDELRLAEAAVAIGTNRLAKDGNDQLGLTWLRFSAVFAPEDDRLLKTFLALSQGKAPQELKAPVDEDGLLKALVKRAEELREKDGKSDPAKAQLAYLEFKVAETFRPQDRDVLLGLMRLKHAGQEGELDELLNRRIEPSRAQTAVTGTQPADVGTSPLPSEASPRADRKGKYSWEDALLAYSFNRDTLVQRGDDLYFKNQVRTGKGAALDATPVGAAIVDTKRLLEKGVAGDSISLTGEFAIHVGKDQPDAFTGRDFSVVFWVKPRDFNVHNQFLFFGPPAMRLWGRHINFCGVGRRTDDFTNSQRRMAESNWLFIAYTIQKGKETLYLDGKVDTEREGSEVPVKLEFVFGAQWSYKKEANQFFQGLLDEAAVWDRALTRSEVDELYRLAKAGKSYCAAIGGEASRR